MRKRFGSLSLKFNAKIVHSSFRFKDNNIIDNDLYNYNNTLEITAASGLNGTYRCRVVNDFGSEFSDTAVLKIVGMYTSLFL